MVDESALPPPQHEPTDVSDRVMWVGVPVLIATVVVMTLLVLWLFPGRTVDRTLHLPLQHYPTPELQVNPREDMARFRDKELRWLNGTGWVDQSHGIIHIPIDQAMNDVAARGIADWPADSAAVSPEAENPVPPSPAAGVGRTRERDPERAPVATSAGSATPHLSPMRQAAHP